MAIPPLELIAKPTLCRWVCKMIKKKFKSTVLCCAFHPSNGQLIATGCADFKMRIFSTFATDVDGTNVDAGPFANSVGPQSFGEAYVELSALGWIHAVAWSPSGNIVAYTGT
jgi:actin related protein 2/3 complex subunit 1A/1B